MEMFKEKKSTQKYLISYSYQFIICGNASLEPSYRYHEHDLKKGGGASSDYRIVIYRIVDTDYRFDFNHDKKIHSSNLCTFFKSLRY